MKHKLIYFILSILIFEGAFIMHIFKKGGEKMSDDLNVKAGIDTTDFKTGISQLNASVKSIEAGFRASAAVMDNWSGTSNGLRERVASLSDILEKQKSKLSILHDEYNKVVESEGANSKAAESLASKMFSAEKAISNTESSISKFGAKLRTVDAEEKSSTGLGKLKSAFSGLAEQSKKSTSIISSHLSNLKSTILGFGAAALAGLSLKSIMGSTDAAEKTMAQMGAVLKSTGSAAGMTQKQLTDLAGAQAKVTTYSKGTTEQAENMLLTFTNIKSNVFPETIKATEDMATAMKMNATDAAKTLGKALNDPAAGLSKLTKQGVTFTDAQKKQITAMQKAGDTAGAQKIILQELEKEFGGSAKAAGSTFTGGLQIMQNNLKSAGVTIATALIPIVTNIMPSIVNAANELASTIMAHKGEIIGAVSAVAGVVKSIFSFAESHGPLVKGVVIGIASAVGIWKLAMLTANTVSTISNALQALGIIKSGAAAEAKLTEAAATEAATTAQAGLNVAMLPTIGIVAGIVAGVALLAFGAYELVKHWKSVSAFFGGLWKGIKSGASSIVGSVKGAFGTAANSAKSAWNGIGNFFKSLWNGVKNITQTVWNGIKSAAMAIITPFVNGITNIWKSMSTGVATIMNGLKEVLSGIWLAIKTVILGPVLLIIDLVTGNFTKLSTDAQGIFNNLKIAFSTIWNGIKQVFTGTVQAIVGFLKTEWSGIVNIGKATWNGFKEFMSALWNGIKTVATTVWNGIKSFFSSLWVGTVNTGKSIFNGFKSFFTSLWNGLVSFITGLPGKFTSGVRSIGTAIVHGFDSALSFIKNLPSKMLEWGEDMINGLIRGIRNMIGKVGDAVSSVGDKIRSYLHFSRPDEGPMRDYESWMPDMIEGMRKGILNNVGKLKSAALNAATVLSNGLKANMNVDVNYNTIPSTVGSNSETTSIQNSYGALLHVDKIEIANDIDIQTLAYKLEFYRQQYANAKGGI